MTNQELIEKLLAEQDPETLMRLVHNTARQQMSEVVAGTVGNQILHKVSQAIHANPELAKRISGEPKIL